MLVTVFLSIAGFMGLAYMVRAVLGNIADSIDKPDSSETAKLLNSPLVTNLADKVVDGITSGFAQEENEVEEDNSQSETSTVNLSSEEWEICTLSYTKLLNEHADDIKANIVFINELKQFMEKIGFSVVDTTNSTACVAKNKNRKASKKG